MKENLQTMTRDLFGKKAREHLGQLLGRSPESLEKSVDRSIDSVLEGFSSVVHSENGRKVLHEAIQNSDDAAVRDPASRFQQRLSSDVFRDGNSQLASIVGDVRRRTMVEELQVASNLPYAESEKILGYVVPGVLSVAKTRVSRGGATNTPDGIGRLFQSEAAAGATGAASAGAGQAAAAVQSSGSQTAAAGGAYAATAANDGGFGMSRFFRFFLPLLLLLGLVLLTMKNCSVQKSANEQQTKLETELVGVKGQYETATASVETLTGELEATGAELEEAKSESARLGEEVTSLTTELTTTRESLEQSEANAAELDGKLQSVSAELEEVKDVPTDTAELQQLLGNVSSERDAANGFYEETLQSLDTRTAELAAMTEGRDAAKLRIGEYESANATLNKRLDRAIDKNMKLREQLNAAEATGKELELQLADTNAELEKQTAGRAADVNRLSANSADLQGQLSTMLGMRDEANRQLTERDGEVTALSDKVTVLEGEIVELNEANAQAQQEAAALEEKILALNGELDTTRQSVDETSATLATTEESLATANSDLEAVRADIEKTTAERDDLLQQRDALTTQVETLSAEKDAALQDIEALNGQVATLSEDLSTARAADADSQEKLGALNGLFSGLQSELGTVRGARDDASAQSKQLQGQVADLEKELVKVAEDLGAAQDEHNQALAAMQGERDDTKAELDSVQKTLQAEIASLETQRDEALAKIEQANADLATLNAEKAEAQTTIEEMNTAALALQADLDTERDAVAGLQANVGDLEATRDSLSAARDSSNVKVDELNGEITTLQGALQGEREKVGELSATISELEGVRDGLTKERDDALGTIDSLEGQLQESGNTIAALNDSNQGLQGQIDDAAAEQQSQLDATASVRSEIEAKLADAGVASASVAAIEDSRAVAIVLESGDLFNVGSSTVSNQGREILGTVGSVVAEYPDWKLDVEGHTDSQGIGAVLRQKFPTNWELSTARASAAVRYLSARAGIDATRMSARGFGDTKPLESNDTAAGREKNRRVELILRR